MADTTEPVLQDCIKCGALIDISDEEPFALMHCPTCGAAMRVRRNFGSFELQEVLGAGGMGAVYRALDVNLHRSVALKLLRREYSNNPEFTRQFAHEAAVTALVNHPNVVKVYSSGADGGLFYIAMELVDKGSLDDLMTVQGRVSELQVLEVGIQIAKGLNAALQRGLIHRDVKPGNILFADAQNAKIVDFGLAVPVDEAGTLGGEIWGTPYYVAPEKLEHKPEDFRSDMYSLGASLFHAIAGRPPYEAEDASVVALKHVKSQPVSLQSFAPDVSGATTYVINKTLNKDPDQRYQSYDEFIQHLEYAQSELRAKAGKPQTRTRVIVDDSHSQRVISWVTLGMVAAVALGGLALFTFKDQIFGPAPAPGATSAEVQEDGGKSLNADYEAARQQLIADKYDEAARAFRDLESNLNVQEPMRSWSGFHAGLAWTLAGNLNEARADWTKLIDRGAFSSAPEDQNLAEFFLETARRASSPEPSPESVAQDYSRVSYESLAPLVLGAKSWALGAFDEGAALLRHFHSALPAGGNSWVGDYKPIAISFLNDFTAFQRITQRATAATTPDQQKAALPELKEALASLKLKGGLTDKAEALVRKMETDVAAHEEETARARAEQEATDAKALNAAKAKANPLALQYRFNEAKAALASVSVTTEKGKRERDGLIKRAEWLSTFKTQLVRDLSALGYAAPILKKTGGQLPGVNRATDTHVETKTPYGSLPVPWTDISYESVFTMARAFLRPDLPAQRQADRKWLLGVYAFFAGKATEGRALLTEASQLQPDYQAQLPLLLELVENP
ncbi:protein kinase domain-containing protein [Verrucomicrobiota bacterium sgz303538]